MYLVNKLGCSCIKIIMILNQRGFHPIMEKRRCVRVFIAFFHEVKLGRLLVDCSMGKFACLYRVTRSINGFTLQCSSELLA